jgi:hypothetical protein
LQASLAQHPNDPELLSALARAAAVLSRETKDTLFQTHPESGQAHQAAAADYQALQKNTDAETEYRKALAIQPDLDEREPVIPLRWERGTLICI